MVVGRMMPQPSDKEFTSVAPAFKWIELPACTNNMLSELVAIALRGRKGDANDGVGQLQLGANGAVPVPAHVVDPDAAAQSNELYDFMKSIECASCGSSVAPARSTLHHV